MTIIPPPRRAATRHARGFTLLEVLLAIAIFGIATVAIAAIFPVAARLQRQTNDVIVGQQIETNVSALLQADPFDGAALVAADANINTDEVLHTLPNTSSFLTKWSREDRSYPSKELIGLNPYDSDVSKKPYYWVVLVRDDDNDQFAVDWQTYVIVLRKPQIQYYPTDAEIGITASDSNYASYDDKDLTGTDPRTKTTRRLVPFLTKATVTVGSDRKTLTLANGSPSKLVKGDWFIDDLGNQYLVREATATTVTVNYPIMRRSDGTDPPTKTIWYAPAYRDTKRNPILRIFQVSNAVVGGP